MFTLPQVSTYQAGCFFGALLGYPVGALLGRKRGLFATAIVFCLGAAIMLAANGDRGLGPIYGGASLFSFCTKTFLTT